MIKDLLLIVDNGLADGEVVDAALRMAERHDAHLAVAVISAVPVPGFSLGVFPPSVTLDPYRQKADAKERDLRERAGRAGREIEIRVLSDAAHALLDAAPAQTRYADLILFGPAESWEDRWLRRRLVENAVLGSGRPVLLLPADGRTPEFRHAVVGWNASAEATRAVHALLPLLTPGAELVAAVVNPDISDGAHGSEPGADLARHLARHRHRVDVVAMEIGAGLESEALYGIVRARGADLLVLGAYGRSRLRELVLGGVTHAVIGQTDFPTLLVH